MDIHDVVHGPVQSHSGPPMVSDNPLGSPRSPRSVKYIKIVSTHHLLARDVFELQFLQ